MRTKHDNVNHLLSSLWSDPAWREETIEATTQELHGLDLDAIPNRTLVWCKPVDEALVVSRVHNVDSSYTRNGLNLVRRKSGGGAVFVDPKNICWFDLVIDNNDSLFDPDVSRSFSWLGQLLKKILMDLDIGKVEICDSYIPGQFGQVACFAGCGPGELMINGKKLIGISQRRTKNKTRFQCSLYTSFDPAVHARLIQNDFHKLETTLREIVTTLDINSLNSFTNSLRSNLGIR